MMMNSGRASSSCVVRMFQVYWASSLSRGMSRKIASSTVPVTAGVQPIHQAARQEANSTTNMVRTTSSIGYQLARKLLSDRTGAHVEVLERQAEQSLEKIARRTA